jgi:hypothetical protein
MSPSRSRTGRETLQPLAPLVAQTLQRAGLGRVVLLSRLTQRWEAIVGPQLAAVARPDSVRSRVLFIVVTDAIWLQQLIFFQSQLLRNMRNVLGEVPIDRLHFALAIPAVQSASCHAVVEAEPLPLTTAEEQQVLADTEGISDPELREVVRRAWRRGWQAGRLRA